MFLMEVVKQEIEVTTGGMEAHDADRGGLDPQPHDG
jgi:hypothetical protein